MASGKVFLDYVLEQLSDRLDLSYRPMMGEFVIYSQGKVIGGIYDDRFLLKKTKSALELLKDTGNIQTAIPYEGAKEMLVADIDDRELTCRLIEAITDDLPEPKKKR
ncbi:MAG: competence protein TfoX [Erysipelotrichaceae bacterium]|nr:competence protein TfoX [Erysipelotrichaceae bacterium]